MVPSRAGAASAARSVCRTSQGRFCSYSWAAHPEHVCAACSTACQPIRPTWHARCARWLWQSRPWCGHATSLIASTATAAVSCLEHAQALLMWDTWELIQVLARRAGAAAACHPASSHCAGPGILPRCLQVPHLALCTHSLEQASLLSAPLLHPELLAGCTAVLLLLKSGFDHCLDAGPAATAWLCGEPTLDCPLQTARCAELAVTQQSRPCQTDVLPRSTSQQTGE